MSRYRVIICALAATIAGLAATGCQVGKPDAEADVLAFEMPIASDATPPAEEGYVWAALEIEVCSNVTADDGVAVERSNWTLELSDETRISPAEHGLIDTPGPEVEGGGIYMLSYEECLTGWITYAVPEGSEPEAAIYSGAGESKRISLP